MCRHAKLPKNRREFTNMGFDLCNYVMYLKYNSSVEMNVFNHVLLMLAFPLNIFLFCNRLIANENVGTRCDFDALFEPVLIEVSSPSMNTVLQLINEVYDESINIEDVRYELCLRTYKSFEVVAWRCK